MSLRDYYVRERARGRATSSPGLTGKALGMRLESKEGALKR